MSAFIDAVDRDDADDAAFETNHRCVHSMISSAAIFGYPALSAAARAAEEAFDARTKAGTPAIRQRVAEVLRLADDVLDSANAGN